MDYSNSDFDILFKPVYDPDRRPKRNLFLVGLLLTPITLIGALWGYKRAYNRKLLEKGQLPTLDPIHPFALKAMYIFAGVAWGICIGAFLVLLIALNSLYDYRGPGFFFYFIICYLVPNSIISWMALKSFHKWRLVKYANKHQERTFGTARIAEERDLEPYAYFEGHYIGGGYHYSNQGHILTVAGTRSGKFTNIIAPNLLGASREPGSWFIIDPKGEAAFVTARYQKKIGNDVHVIDPWGVYSKESSTFNPLDITSDDEEELVDDATMMAQMIVPSNNKTNDPYWDDKARSLIAALIVYCVEHQAKKVDKDNNAKTLTTIWRWLRLDAEKFADLMFDMSECSIEMVSLCANEMLTMKKSDKTFASVIAHAHAHTDFLKSISLQRSLAKSSFDVNELAKGKSTIYVVLPPDKLESHSRWLRLITSIALRATVRNRGKRVTFLLDEFSSLGNMPDIPVYMGLGAGYNITIWPIFQSLIQLKTNYGDSWELFLSGAAVKHFFGVNDNFSAEYISIMSGDSTYLSYDRDAVDGDLKPVSRRLITPDEVRRTSSRKIFTFIDQNPVALLDKFPYYHMGVIKDEANKNPYYVKNEASA